MKAGTISNIVGKCLFAFTLVLMAAGLYFMGDANQVLERSLKRREQHRNDPAFRTITIQSKIDSIEYYDKGTPRVMLGDGRSVRLEIVGKAGSEYVQVGDSIVKIAKTDSVTVYRPYPTYTEVCIFGNNSEHGYHDLDYPYSGLLQRYRIPHNPR